MPRGLSNAPKRIPSYNNSNNMLTAPNGSGPGSGLGRGIVPSSPAVLHHHKEEAKADHAKSKITMRAADPSKQTRIRLPKHQSRLKEILPWIHPKKKKISLAVFRRLFSILNTRYGSTETRGEIPTLHFVRAMQRLSIIIGDKKIAQSLKSYDQDGSGTVGWWEFVAAWNGNSYEIEHTLTERTYLTLDDQTSSTVGFYVSTISLGMIILSSASFVLATLPSMMTQREGCGMDRCMASGAGSYTSNSMIDYCKEECVPRQPEIFGALEVVCVIVFSMEYFGRLLTCWAVRQEFQNDEILIDMILGDQSLRSRVKRERVTDFLLQPPNVVDFLAILPFYIESVAGQNSLEGSVVLRVIRLVRLVRLMKTVKYFEQLRIMGRVIHMALPGLTMLFFYLCLLIVFAGSLVYHAEVGEWNPETNVWERWNWQKSEYESTPFTSIPQSFWWTVVTLTTVGYGDMVPTSLAGQLVGTITIFCGVLVLAMPISVLSSSFGETWREWHEERRLSAAHEAEEREAIEAALSFRDPIAQFHKVAIDIFDEDDHGDHDFLGECDIHWEDIGTGPWEIGKHGAGRSYLYRDLNLALVSNDYKIVGTKRKLITGTIDVRVWWEPKKPENAESGEEAKAIVPYHYMGHDLHPGTLHVKLVRGRGLRNADDTWWDWVITRLGIEKPGRSDPYARLTYWPFLPSTQGIIEDMTARTKTISNTLDPVWDQEFALVYSWNPDDLAHLEAAALEDADQASQVSGPQMASTRVSGQTADPTGYGGVPRAGGFGAAGGGGASQVDLVFQADMISFRNDFYLYREKALAMQQEHLEELFLVKKQLSELRDGIEHLNLKALTGSTNFSSPAALSHTYHGGGGGGSTGAALDHPTSMIMPAPSTRGGSKSDHYEQQNYNLASSNGGVGETSNHHVVRTSSSTSNGASQIDNDGTMVLNTSYSNNSMINGGAGAAPVGPGGMGNQGHQGMQMHNLPGAVNVTGVPTRVIGQDLGGTGGNLRERQIQQYQQYANNQPSEDTGGQPYWNGLGL